MRPGWLVAGTLALAACSSPAPKRVAPADAGPPPRAECPEPQLPAAALAAHVTGVTRIAYEVEESGKVVRVALVHPSGDSEAHKQRDEAVVAARSQCRFPPLPGGGLRKGEEEFVWR
jgi:TonB family protein